MPPHVCASGARRVQFVGVLPKSRTAGILTRSGTDDSTALQFIGRFLCPCGRCGCPHQWTHSHSQRLVGRVAPCVPPGCNRNGAHGVARPTSINLLGLTHREAAVAFAREFVTAPGAANFPQRVARRRFQVMLAMKLPAPPGEQATPPTPPPTGRRRGWCERFRTCRGWRKRSWIEHRWGWVQ